VRDKPGHKAVIFLARRQIRRCAKEQVRNKFFKLVSFAYLCITPGFCCHADHRCADTHVCRGRLGRNVIFALEFNTTINRSILTTRNLWRVTFRKTTMRISGIFTSCTSMDENISRWFALRCTFSKGAPERSSLCYIPKRCTGVHEPAYNYVFFYHQRCGLSGWIWSGHT